MGRRIKLVYNDGKSKVLFGELIDEDNLFVHILTIDGIRFRIAKTTLVSMKDLEVQ